MQQVLDLLADGQERHGYEIMTRTGLKSGAVYPILTRLMERGALVARWEEVDPRELGRPRRRYYRRPTTHDRRTEEWT
ncbi:MAG: PadR family transcriptional regulator [Streptosporangiaceae bacterium]|nr:PadR family transcriptional regulator [Streptosporangiaceae bacterium]